LFSHRSKTGALNFYCLHPQWQTTQGESIGTGSCWLSSDKPPKFIPDVCPTPDDCGCVELQEYKVTNPDHKYFGQVGIIKFVELDIDGVVVTHLSPDDVRQDRRRYERREGY